MNGRSTTVAPVDAASAASGARRPTGLTSTLPLRLKLPLVMTLYLVLFLTLALILVYGTLRRLTADSIAHRLENAAAQIGATAEASMAGRYEREERVASDPAVQRALTAPRNDATVNAAREALRGLAAPALPVLLRDAHGNIVTSVHAGAERGFPPPPPAHVAQLHLIGSLFSAGERTLAWSVAAIVEDSALIGSIASLMRIGGPAHAPEWIMGLTGESVIMHVRSADGTIWSRAPGVAAEAPSGRIAQGGTLQYERTGVGRTLAAEHAIAETPFVMVLEAPVSSVNTRVWRTLRPLIAASLVLLLLGIAVSWVISGRMTRPIGEVAHAVASLSGGDYAARVAGAGGDEIGRLAAGFNAMAAELERSRRELMDRMQEATAARLEAERLRTEAEHARVSADEARHAAERASQAKGDFLAVMSHELRTPLNAIGGYSQLLELGLHGPVTPAQRQALERIAHNQNHLLRLINDVLSYSRLDAGFVSFMPEHVRVADVLADLDLTMAPQVAARDVSLELKPAGDAAVYADRDKLHQILLNLLANAVKFTPAGGRIEVGCEATADVVAIHVRDSGIGIAEDRLEAIFDPFFQADRSLSHPGEGVGLGLAISRDLARGMDGDIFVSSIRGAGSTFTLELPACAPAAHRRT